MEIEYCEELPESLKPQAAALFLEVLGDKLTPILGGGERGRRTLLAGMNTRRCLAAVEDGQLIGLLAIHTERGGFIDPSFADLREIYGTIGALWRLAGLSVLSYNTGDAEWHVEGIAIVTAGRGRGIGTHLMNWFEELAAIARIERLTLQVIDTNPRARSLYESLGYETTTEQTAFPFDRIFGFPFRKVISMEKRLA